MRIERPLNQSSAVRAFLLFINMLLIVAIVGACLSAILAPVGLVGVFREDKASLVRASIFFCSLLTSAAYLWVIYFLRKLMLTVQANNPFDLMNPGRIRKIAYAVFAIVPIDLYTKLFIKGFQKAFDTVNYVDLLWGSLFKMIFLGFGLLIIAKVFELGVELKRDQEMTI